MVLAARAAYTEQPGGKLISVPLAPGVVIYDGALVAIANGGANDSLLINWTDPTSAAHFFLGLARITETVGVPATSGEAKTGNTAGSEEAAVDVSGVILKGVSIGNALLTTVGNLVYAIDENTFDANATGGGNPVGWLSRYVSGAGTIIGDVKLFSADEYRAHRGI